MFDTKTDKPRPDVLKQHFILDGRIEKMAALCPIKKDAAPLRQEKTKKNRRGKKERKEANEKWKKKETKCIGQSRATRIDRAQPALSPSSSSRPVARL